MKTSLVQSVCLPRIAPQSAMKGLSNNIHLIEMRNREGAAPQPSAPCRSSNTVGRHEQRAHAEAISVAHDVLVAARESASKPRDRDALDKSLGHIGQSPQQSYGSRVMDQLTVLGAVLASARHAAQAAPDNKELADCQRKLESAIVKIGLTAGACKGIATGGYHGGTSSEKLTDALRKGQEAMLACRQAMGDSVLLDGIVSAVLPAAMMQSLVERMPDVAAQYQGRMQELDLLQVLQKQYADATWSGVEHQMQTGCPEAFATAVFSLLKLPEYVMEGEPANRDAEQPAATPVPDGKFPPIPTMPSGSNQAVNQNYVDNSGFGKALSGFADMLASISNFTHKDAVALGMDLGRAEERVAFLTDENAGLRAANTELRAKNAGLRNQNTDLQNRLEHLERKYDDVQQRLNSWGSFPPHVETKTGASNGTDSGHGSVDGRGDMDVESISDHNEPNVSGLNTNRTVSGDADNPGLTTAQWNELVERYAVLQQDANDGPLSVAFDQRQNASPLSEQRPDSIPQDEGVAVLAHAQSGEDVTDADDQRVSDAAGSRGAISVMHSGPEVGTVEIMGQQNVRASNDHPEHSDAVQRKSVDAAASGSVRRLIEMFERMGAATTQFHTPPAFDVAGALRPGREAATVAEATRSSSVAGVEQFTTSTTRLEFSPLPRARLNHARNEVDAPNAENEAAQNYVEQEDEMSIQFSGWKSPALNIRNGYVEVITATEHSVESGSPRAKLQKHSSVNHMFQDVQAAGAAKLRKDLITEFRTLVDFRGARGTSLSAVKNQDEFRRHWESLGGLRFSPPVVPVPAGKETLLIREHELEKVFDQMAQNRSRKNTPLLQGISRPRSDRGPTMQGVERWVSRGLDSSPVPVPKASVEVETAPSISASSGGNWTFGPVAQPDLASKKLFEDRPSQIRQQRIAPVLKSLVGG